MSKNKNMSKNMSKNKNKNIIYDRTRVYYIKTCKQ